MEKFREIFYFLRNKWYIFVIILICLLICGIGVFIFIFNNNSTTEEKDIETAELLRNDDETDTSNNNEECLVTVDIKGEIKEPGLYKTDCNSRIQDVIELAGGITSNADTSVLNLSKRVFDEMVIIIYSKKEVNNFSTVKNKEIEKNENCQTNTNSEIKNDACIDNQNKAATNSNTEYNTSNNNSKNDLEKNNQATQSKNETVLQPNSININQATSDELVKLPGIGASKATKIIDYRNQNGLFKTIDEIKNVKGIGNSIFEKIKSYITV